MILRARRGEEILGEGSAFVVALTSDGGRDDDFVIITVRHNVDRLPDGGLTQLLVPLEPEHGEQSVFETTAVEVPLYTGAWEARTSPSLRCQSRRCLRITSCCRSLDLRSKIGRRSCISAMRR